MIGYSGGLGDPQYGLTQIDFNMGKPILRFIPNSKIYLFEANAVYSDENGKLLYYTNGYEIENSDFKLMANGDNLGVKYWSGLVSPQNVLFLPFPEKKDSTLLFYPNLRRVSSDFYEIDLRYCLLNNSLNNGKGKIIERDKIIINDTLSEGGLTSCKHANGRDWWILMNELNSNKFYKILIDPQGVSVMDTQLVGDVIIDGLGQSKFSPDGSFYAVYQSVSDSEGAYLYLYSFNRCNGMLSYIATQHINKSGWGGIEFSPNSRFLYHCSGLQLYQYDLHETITLENRIEIDTIIDRYLPWGSSYFLQQLGPDGRIYISNPYSSDIMHVINNPDQKGLGCNPTYNSFKLLTINAGSISNMPNYRLGKIQGSICDSLNIDNIPLAHWRYEQDTSNYLEFIFTDLSAYEVKQWCWNFGDPDSRVKNISMDKNPIHIFSKNGTYDVCLIVKNNNGADTLCRTVKIGPMVSTHEGLTVPEIHVWPNPCEEFLIINVLDYNPQSMILHFYNQFGILLKNESLYQGSNIVEMDQLLNGVYFIKVSENGNEIMSVKIIKL
ncbi:MAG: T9SS type A sorting domain-containing protein [Saprospiraceae bacterium]|nr:T9SS type A sorting domain-containing protein [Saprospiraceae bacterium]MBK9722496.1 T9SS type A sorting domain-containing protein [Saprospiraceae bacterium]